MVEAGLCCEEAARQLIVSCLSRHEIALMEEHIPGFNREWLTVQGAETHKETLLNPAGPRQESWPQKPAPEPAQRINQDTAQVTLRGKPLSEAIITVVVGEITDKPGVQFYDASFKIEADEMVFGVYKTHHKLEELQQECQVIQEAGGRPGFGTDEKHLKP